MNETKELFTIAYKALPETKRADLLVYYDKISDESVIRTIITDAKRQAESVINYADRKGYGYGEVGYNLNEEVNDFAEEVPELKRQYKSLLYGYFDMLVEAKEA